MTSDEQIIYEDAAAATVDFLMNRLKAAGVDDVGMAVDLLMAAAVAVVVQATGDQPTLTLIRNLNLAREAFGEKCDTLITRANAGVLHGADDGEKPDAGK